MQLSVAQQRPGGYVGGGAPMGADSAHRGVHGTRLFRFVIEGYRFDVG